MEGEVYEEALKKTGAGAWACLLRSAFEAQAETKRENERERERERERRKKGRDRDRGRHSCLWQVRPVNLRKGGRGPDVMS